MNYSIQELHQYDTKFTQLLILIAESDSEFVIAEAKEVNQFLKKTQVSAIDIKSIANKPFDILLEEIPKVYLDSKKQVVSSLIMADKKITKEESKLFNKMFS